MLKGTGFEGYSGESTGESQWRNTMVWRETLQISGGWYSSTWRTSALTQARTRCAPRFLFRRATSLVPDNRVKMKLGIHDLHLQALRTLQALRVARQEQFGSFPCSCGVVDSLMLQSSLYTVLCALLHPHGDE